MFVFSNSSLAGYFPLCASVNMQHDFSWICGRCVESAMAKQASAANHGDRTDPYGVLFVFRGHACPFAAPLFPKRPNDRSW